MHICYYNSHHLQLYIIVHINYIDFSVGHQMYHIQDKIMCLQQNGLPFYNKVKKPYAMNVNIDQTSQDKSISS